MTLAAPLADAVTLAGLLALEIEAHPPAAAVTGVAISARVVPRRAAPAGLWQPPAPAPRDLAGVLARLTTLVGGANVGAPVALDSHRPDASALTTFSGQPGMPGDERPREATAGALALRRLRPPRAVSVEALDGRPVRVTDPAAGTLVVVTCAGPWRISGDWWDVNVWARDEWDVALTDDTVWRLAHDRLTNQWALDGVYD
jgi:protein ImuB